MEDSRAADQRPTMHWVPVVDEHGRTVVEAVWALPRTQSTSPEHAHAA